MKRKMLLRLAALPFIAAMGAVPAVSGCDVVSSAACPDFNASANFGANLDIDVDVKTFMQAAGNFQVLGEAMVKEVGDACVTIAKATGGDESVWSGKEGSDYVKAACAEADAKLQVALQGVSISVLIEGGQCKVSLKATAECNASCDVSGKCTPAQLQAKCEPGKLAGKCEGECKGTCSADAGSVSCTGSCDATCTGSCSGQCTGRCEGNCNGTCDGAASSAPCPGTCVGSCDSTCTGKCEAECAGDCSGQCKYTDPQLKCAGTCHGECTVEYQAPYCEGEFQPPECDIDAECQANCEASATAQAECTPPKVTYSLTNEAGTDLSALAAALEAALPVFIVNTVDRGEGLVASAEAMVDAGDRIAGKADLAVDAAACATAAAAAALEAAANIKVSVEFSVSVSATATAGASSAP